MKEDAMFAAKIRATAAVVLLPLIAGCSAIGALGDATTPLSVYDLRAPVGAPVAQGNPLARDVIVELPTTSGVLETDRIMIRPDAVQAQYLPDARWGDEVPVMLQTLMLRSLENTNGVTYVGRRPLAGSGDYAIVTELVDFQAELAPDGVGALVVMRMTSRMVREQDASIVSSRSFSTSVAAPSTQNADLVAAFDLAADSLMIDFADWTMTTLGRRLVQP